MRIFPIALQIDFSDSSDSSDSSNCGADAVGAVPKQNLPLARREFLKGSGVLMGTIASGSVLAALAPSLAWALALKTLTKPEGDTLMAMGRVLYPHKKLPDAVYALLVKDLDAKAAADPATASMLRAGLAALNANASAAGGSFIKASAARKLEIVSALEGQPFFGAVRGQCVTSLYDNDMAYAVFGYEGASWDKGGYLTRGFQDLSWLPAPSLEASPALKKG